MAVALAAGGIAAGLAATSGSGPGLETLVPPAGYSIYSGGAGYVGPYPLTFGPGDTLVGLIASSGGPDRLAIWNASTGKLISPPASLAREAQENSDPGWNDGAPFTLSPDGRLAAVNDDSAVVSVWRIATGQRLTTVSAQSKPILALSATGTLVTAGFLGDGVELWDTATGSLLRSLDDPDGRVAAVAISPDGKTVAVGNVDGTVLMWSAATGREIARLTPPAPGGGRAPAKYFGLDQLAFDPAGTALAVATLGTTSVWSVPGHAQAGPLVYDGQFLGFTAGGSTIVTTSPDGHAVDFVDVRSGKTFAAISSPGDQFIAGGTLNAAGNELAVFDLVEGYPSDPDVYVWDNLP